MSMPVHVINIYIGEKVKEYRELKGITQEQLAKVIGRTRASIVNMEQGRQSTSLDKIYTIAIYLGVNLNDLIPDVEWFALNKNKKLKKIVTYQIID